VRMLNRLKRVEHLAESMTAPWLKKE
jgi:hypothetical protein